MESLYHLLSPRISWILAPDKLVLEVDAERVEWPLNKEISVPNKDIITSFIHLDAVETETGLWGLFMPNKSCVFFSSLHSFDLSRYTFKVWITQRSVSFSNAKISSFGGVLPFFQVFSNLQNWTQLFLQRGIWSKYQGDGYLSLWKLTSVPIALRALR